VQYVALAATKLQARPLRLIASMSIDSRRIGEFGEMK